MREQPRRPDGGCSPQAAWTDFGEALHLVEDRDSYSLGGRQRLLVGEAENVDADGGQRGVPLGVALEANFVAVLRAVDLDGKFGDGSASG